VDDNKDKKRLLIRERPKDLCQDESLMINVVADVLIHYDIPQNSYVWLLQPTSPFRNYVDFIEVFRIITSGKFKSCISVSDVNSNHPNRMGTIKNSELYPLRHYNFLNKQDLLRVYIRNGGFYVAKARAVLQKNSFYIKKCGAYVMPFERSVNIDNQYDLFLAKAINELSP